MATSKANRTVFIDLTVPQKILYSKDRVIDMTGNANFPAPYPPPAPSLATITSVTNDLETKQLAADGGGHTEIVARDAAVTIWNNTMRAAADYVDSMAQGDAVIITSAGFIATDIQRTASQLPHKPKNLIIKHSEESGVILFSCDVVENAEAYVAVLSTDANFPITSAGTTLIISTAGATPAPLAAPPPPPSSGSAMVAIDASKERRKTIRGLPSEKRMHARMYCFNATGRGPDSDAISIVVG